MKLVEEGKEAPNQFYEKPDIEDHEMFYWKAFHDLSSERDVGMGLGPIPYSAIRNYADEYDIRSRDEFDYFLNVIRSLDAEYVKITNAPKDKTDMVPISDVTEQHRMFSRIKARAKKR